MHSKPREVVAEVFPKMLEELGFLFADPDESPSPPGMPHDAVRVQIAFSGEMGGEIDMGIGRSLGAEIASNLLGLDLGEENIPRAGDDALRELLNVTCGHILTTFAGDRPVFNLTIPEVTPMDGAAWDALARDKDTAIFGIDGRPVQLRLRLQP